MLGVGNTVTDRITVFGAPAMADSGQLLCVLAGPAAVVEKVKPYTAGVIGRAIIDFSGEEHGKATLLKIIGNTFVINMVEALGQGLTLAEKSSLGADNLHKFIEVMFPGPYTAYSTRMREGDYYKREEVRKPLNIYDYIPIAFSSHFSLSILRSRTPTTPLL
jgi:3-hydroxyisobutyrate dehydrogenase-like beta-hydroxyacid dehydrogenase